MKFLIRPVQDAHQELDITHRLVSAIAEELWCRHGGNGQLNWIEAERHLQRIVSKAGGAPRPESAAQRRVRDATWGLTTNCPAHRGDARKRVQGEDRSRTAVGARSTER
jgi:hypothetical protein